MQQQALAPLSGKWDSLNEAQKRKWLALSRNFTRLAPPEQQKMHSRMTEWAALTQQQRAQARFNYGETRKLSVEDRKAKWEAYQALSADEKKKLATGAAKAPATAAAVRPPPGEKMAPLPRGKASQPNLTPPRIASHRLDQHTLLPQPAPTAPAHSVD